MLKGIDRGILPLLNGVKSITTSAVSAQYAPAVASSSGILNIFGGSRVSTPLSEPLPDVLIPKPEKAPATAPQLATSSLATGTKLATLDTPGPTATITLFVPSGSASETPASSGAAYLLPHLAFKSTTNRTTFRLTRELERFGAVASASSSRDHTAFTIDFPKLFVPEAVELLLDATLNPKFNPWEVQEAKHFAEDALDAAHSNPLAVITEILHRAAYDGGLGQALLPSPATLSAITPETLTAFTSSFSLEKAVIGAAGVDHGALSTLLGPLLSSSAASEAAPKSTYVGGAVNVVADSPDSYVALAFEAKGGLADPKAAAIAAVLSTLLHPTREPVPWMHKAADGAKTLGPISQLYGSTGLVGLSGSIKAGQTSKLLDVMTQKLHTLAKGVTDVELQAAKGAVIGGYLGAVQGGQGLVKEIGSQLLTRGKYDQLEYVSKVQGLTTADVTAFLQAALKTPATIVSYGSLAGMPRYQEVARRFS